MKVWPFGHEAHTNKSDERCSPRCASPQPGRAVGQDVVGNVQRRVRKVDGLAAQPGETVKPVNGNVMVKNEILDIVDMTLFLGFTLDAKLRWNSHITRLAKRLNSAAYAVKRTRQLTDESTARLFISVFFIVS
ncbi:hypothetical protein EVAR_33527_1 [Eumeta japonica]|uniref:Uncharacterized protein n=1 Tax=Eumeta variegata TaxID=151549 RepID=A0A4C1VJL0_EUMVA|nr:hypothetical protein EVAR_33527_1 [Eumeta japonica]